MAAADVDLRVPKGRMTLDRMTTGANVIDVLDHVLDKGIVIDAWIRASLAAIDLVTVDAHIVVASISTYLFYAGGGADIVPVAGPAGPAFSRLRALEAQLRRVQEDMELLRFEPHDLRRAEDRLRDELHDSLARTVLPKQ
jgi:hypothetical protein